MTLPAYISGVPDISDKAVSGIGTALPPHVSIRGNKFTLVDGAGNKKLLGDTMDFLVVDLGDHVGKMYYPEKWNKDSDDPPTCWSANGIGPSREAITPQARTCAECQWNVRGSKISETGASVKACRDEILTAIVHPQLPGMLFQFKITPGSFKNWRKHVEECKAVAQGAHVGVVITHASFEDEQNGVLVFKAISYPDQATWDARNKAVTSKATDALVGRLDRPRELPAPTVAAASITHQPETSSFGAPSAATNLQPQTAANSAAPAPAAEPEQQRRKRRTKAEIEADNQKAAGAAPFGNTGQPAMAPFRPEAPPPAGNGAAFGIATNPPGPSAEIEASLAAAFGKPAAGGGFGAS